MNRYKINGVVFSESNGQRYCEINQCGIKAIYPYDEHVTKYPVKYLLCDLDGTTVKSEEFWIYLIELTIQSFVRGFSLCEDDIPFVSGFSTVEHLEYCIKKYGVNCTVDSAVEKYHEIAKRELDEISQGRGNISAFKPREGLKEFLLKLKSSGVKIGLATSGLDYKAIPEIKAAFAGIGLDSPENFYDGIVTGGRRKTKGGFGTIGELAIKPHPWIYSELAFGIGVKDKSECVVLEDSSAGLISGRLAGFNVIGFRDGNIEKSGMNEECIAIADTFHDVLNVISGESSR